MRETAMHETILILWLAMAFDRYLPDPPNRYHPVAWMGSGIALFRRLAPESGRLVPFLVGLSLVLGGGAVMFAVGIGIQQWLGSFHVVLQSLAAAYLLSLCFAAEGLFRAGLAVERPLADGCLSDAREQLSYHLVSRPTGELNDSQVAAATIESLGENTCDSVVAPLFYFVVGGLPLALLYRFVNTCDAMLGYRDTRHEWLGKASARTDDVLNLLPARLTAVCILAGGLGSRGFRPAVRIWWRDRYLTSSPNAGQTIGALAGRLGVELEKVGAYRVGQGQSTPETDDISRAIKQLRGTIRLVMLVLTSLLILLEYVGRFHVT